MAFRTLPLEVIERMRSKRMQSEPCMKLMPPGGDEIVARLIALEQEKQALLARWEELQKKRTDIIVERETRPPTSRMQEHGERRRRLVDMLD
jgi:hypothetical protein